MHSIINKNLIISKLVYMTLLLIFFSSPLYANSNTNDSDIKRVLFISSYSPDFTTFDQQIHGIREGLTETNIDLHIEYMDTKKLYTPTNLNNFYASLSYKLEQLPSYDVVVVADDNALNFILEYQDDLFNRIPIIFLGINDIENAIEASKNPYITGIIESPSIGETIEIAAKINPSASHVVALVDNTTSGQADLNNYYSYQSAFNNLVFSDIDLSNMNFEDFTNEVSTLDHNDIVLLLSVYQDNTGQTVTFDAGLKMVLDNSSQPIYHPYYHGLSQGVLGGKVISHDDQGMAAAQIINRIFAGEDIANIPFIAESPNRYIFDYNILQQYKINENLLPEDAIILNISRNFFREYFTYIITALIIMLIQLLFIIFLRLNIRHRKSAENELQLSKDTLLDTNKKLVESNDSLLATNEELSAALEEIDMQDKKIYDLIYIDPLSGLKNRYAITSHLDAMIESVAFNQNLAILFLDIDNFKNINDTYGHEVGDKIIQKTSSILNKLIDNRVSIGRFGGDEFLIIIKDPSNKYFLHGLINMIQELLKDPVKVNNIKFYLTVSIGVSNYPVDGKNRLELIKKADIALYKAKALGKNQFVIYDESLNEDLHKKFFLQNAIKDAIVNQEFFLNYQPYISPNSDSVIGVEALIRWISKDLGYVSPYELITNAEEMGIISEISDWVLREACLFAKRLNSNLDSKLSVSVNISGYQLSQPDFYNNIMKIIESTNVDPSLICLEMTETVMIESIETGKIAINRFQEKGIKIAIDDFGTGYSSLKYFKDLPASIIKIDKSFIDNIVEQGYEYHLVDAMSMLAHQRNMKVVAEGVETIGQLNALQQIECDLIQGYLFSKPLPENDVIDYIQKKNSK